MVGRDPNIDSNQVALDAFSITPSDSTVISPRPRALYIGGTGDVEVTTFDGTNVTFKNVPTGTILPISVQKVHADDSAGGTTATNILGLV